MSEFFLTIVNMSISASWIVLAILLLRLLLKKSPKWITVLLWGIVAVRLICPFTIESVISLIPSTETISPEIMMDRTPEINSGIPIINNIVNPIISESFSPQPMASANPLQILIPVIANFWILGVIAMVIYTVITFLRVKLKIGTAILLRDNIYQSENVVSPFVLGIIKPKIYLPFNMNEEDMGHVISHEQAHIIRKDYLWKPLGFLILTIHWFNPLMWLGYVLLCRDIELACDEKVIKELNTEQKADYSQALLTCSVNRRMITACPLAFGEVGVKQRIKSVLNYKRAEFWVIVVAIILSVVTAVCFLTNPKTGIDDELAVFLDMQISEHHYSEEHTNNNFITISQKVLDVDKSSKETTVYMWVLYHEYSYENGEIKLESGAHIPTVITAKRTAKHGHYELVEYWEPRDGSYYAQDIKNKFPWYLHAKALDSQRYIDEQLEFCDNAAKEYYYGTDVPKVTVSTNDSKKLVFFGDIAQIFKEIFDNAQWIDGTTDCDPEFTINYYEQEKEYNLLYHSDCGTLIDVKNNRSSTLSDVQKTKINTQLFKHAEYFALKEDNNSLESVVSNAIISNNKSDKPTGLLGVESHVILGQVSATPLMDGIFETQKFYMLALYQEFKVSSGDPIEVKRDFSPVIITLSFSENEGYSLEEYQVISSNEQIKEMFPDENSIYDAINKTEFLGQLEERNIQKVKNIMGDVLHQSGHYLYQYDSSVSFANYTNAQRLYTSCWNRNKMYINSVRHLPIFKFETKAELDDFKIGFKDDLTFNHGYNEVPSFNEVSEKYDEDYFKEKTLFLVYVGASSGSFRYGVNSVYNDGKNFYIHIETTNNPEVCTADMSGWFVTVGVDKSTVKNCTTFDADLDNVSKVTSSEYLQLYDVTSTEEIQAKYDNEEFIYQKLHYQATDGTWVCNGYSYKYRLEITGRMSNAAKNTTYIVLSNSKDITFNQAWKASGLSSLMSDYFAPEYAVIVGHKLFS